MDIDSGMVQIHSNCSQEDLRMQNVLIPHCIEGVSRPTGQIQTLGGFSLAGNWSVKLAGGDPLRFAERRAAIQKRLDSQGAALRCDDSATAFGQFNGGAAGSWHTLSEDGFDLLSKALALAADSDGACDPFIGALATLWGDDAQDMEADRGSGHDSGLRAGGHAGTDANRHADAEFSAVASRHKKQAPTGDQIARAMSLSGWRRVEIDHAARRIRQPGGVQLDLSALQIGYMVDSLSAWLESAGLCHYLIDIAGRRRGAGTMPDGQPWWTSLESPPTAPATGAVRAEPLTDTIVALHGLSMASCANYRGGPARRAIVGGDDTSRPQSPHRLRHPDDTDHPDDRADTIDPRTGHPVRNGVAAVTVFHESCLQAEGLATTLAVLGIEKGICHAEARCLAARFLVRQGSSFVACTTSVYQEMQQ
jgi:thiamine biosynthesis lipoprotein